MSHICSGHWKEIVENKNQLEESFTWEKTETHTLFLSREKSGKERNSFRNWKYRDSSAISWVRFSELLWFCARHEDLYDENSTLFSMFRRQTKKNDFLLRMTSQKQVRPFGFREKKIVSTFRRFWGSLTSGLGSYNGKLSCCPAYVVHNERRRTCGNSRSRIACVWRSDAVIHID